MLLRVAGQAARSPLEIALPGLSPILVDQLFELIKNLRGEGISILLVEQNIKKALEVATRGCVMELGSVVLEGASDSLAKDSGLVHAYLGTQN